MVKKTRILFMSDLADTGFGTVGKELTKRWAQDKHFEIHYFGWTANPMNEKLVAWCHEFNVTPHYTAFWNQAADNFGQSTFNNIVRKVKPNIVVALGDPWMIGHANASELRSTYNLVYYVPIDRDVISKSWLNILQGCDVLVLYSQFGVDVVSEQLPFKHPILIKHGVDKSIFKPFQMPRLEQLGILERKAMLKRDMLSRPDNPFIIGYVARNQVRKAIPRVVKAFKAFNCSTWIDRKTIIDGDGVEIPAEKFCNELQCFRCDLCPAFQQREECQNSLLYLHTTPGTNPADDIPGIGWVINELAYRHNVGGRVVMTPNTGALNGVPREHLAMIYNLFDVHMFLSHSEGFGLPIAEGICCGVPTLVTNYSSMIEIVRGGGGRTVKVKDFDCYVSYENEWANADIGDAADQANELFVDKNEWLSRYEECTKNNYIIDWDESASQFLDVFHKLMGHC